MEKAPILVTGGAGFIGSHFVDLCISSGHSVVVLDLMTYAAKRDNLKEALATQRCELVVGDIRDEAKVFELLKGKGCSAVVNFAAESHVDRSISGPDAFIQTNVVGTYSLLQASRRYYQSLGVAQRERFRYLQVSTDEVFGMLGPNDHPFTEKTSYAPSSPYSASKAGADHLVMAWHHTYGLPALITNCSNNYGPRQFPEKLIPHMIACALAEKPLPVYGRGENIRDWIHVQDHVFGIGLALERGRMGESYCFGGRSEKRNIDLVKELCTLLDSLSPRKDGRSYSTQIEFVTDRLGHDFRYAIDDEKAESELGFKRKFGFESGLKATVEWYLNHRDHLKGASA